MFKSGSAEIIDHTFAVPLRYNGLPSSSIVVASPGGIGSQYHDSSPDLTSNALTTHPGISVDRLSITLPPNTIFSFIIAGGELLQ